MPVSWSLHNVETEIDTDELLESLPHYQHVKHHDEITDSLLTDIVDVEENGRSVRCTVRHDEARRIGSRPGDPSFVPETNRTNVRFYEDLLNGPGFIIAGSAGKNAKKEIATILDVNTTELDQITLSSTAITRIVGQDSEDASFGWWRDIDAHTSSASVTGDIEDSTHAQRISDDGRPIWVIFTSRRFDEKAGISTKKVVFYGDGWDVNMKDDFVFDVVLNNAQP